MREYRTSLQERRKRAERYWSDPAARLAQVNRIRRNQGLPPLTDVGQIGVGWRLHAQSRQRGERGRFL